MTVHAGVSHQQPTHPELEEPARAQRDARDLIHHNPGGLAMRFCSTRTPVNKALLGLNALYQSLTSKY